MTAMPDFGRFAGIVRPCVMKPRHVRMLVQGGPGSGKTFGALQLAKGIVGPGGSICLMNAGEHSAEELYAGVVDFFHVDLLAPDSIKAAQETQASWGRINWNVDGADPRTVIAAMQAICPAIGTGGVLIIDSMSDVWDGTKNRVDHFGGNDNRNAWKVIGAPHDEVWSMIMSAPCHVIVCARSKTETIQVQGDDRKKRPIDAPTMAELRSRNRYRLDVRAKVRSDHMVWFEGRLKEMNEAPLMRLTVEVGQRIKAALGGDAAKPSQPPSSRTPSQAPQHERVRSSTPPPNKSPTSGGGEGDDREAELNAAHAELVAWVEQNKLDPAFSIYTKVKGAGGGIQATRAWNSPQRWGQVRRNIARALGEDHSLTMLCRRAVSLLGQALKRDLDAESDEVALLREAITATAAQHATPFDRAAAACLLAERCTRNPETLKKLGLGE